MNQLQNGWKVPRPLCLMEIKPSSSPSKNHSCWERCSVSLEQSKLSFHCKARGIKCHKIRMKHTPTVHLLSCWQLPCSPFGEYLFVLPYISYDLSVMLLLILTHADLKALKEKRITFFHLFVAIFLIDLSSFSKKLFPLIFN